MDRVAFCLEKKRKKKQESQIGFHEEAWTWPNMSWTKSLEEKSKNMSFGKTGKKRGLGPIWKREAHESSWLTDSTVSPSDGPISSTHFQHSKLNSDGRLDF